MDPEINTQNISPKNNTKSITVAIVALIVLALGVFYAQRMGWILKKQEVSVYDEISKFQDLAKQKNYDACITEAQNQIQSDAKNVLAWQWKGICEFESGKYTEAKASFEQILALEPSNQPAKNYLEILSSSSIPVKIEEGENARIAFEALSKLTLSKEFNFTGSSTGAVGQGPELVTGRYTSNLLLNGLITKLEKSLGLANLKYTVNKSLISRVYTISNAQKNYSIYLTANSKPIQIIVRFSKDF